MSSSSSCCLSLDSTDAAIDFVNELSNKTTNAEHLENFKSMNNFNGKSFKQYENVEVLVTGSLHLVGNILSILEPSLNDL